MIVLRGLVVGGVPAAVLVAGCTPSHQDKQARLEKEAHSKVVVQSHDLVHKYYAKMAASVYVGTWVEDPVPLISVPGGTFGKPRYNLSNEVFESLSEAMFRSDDGHECWAHVYRLRPGREPQSNWPLSDEQRAAVRSGSLEVLEVRTTCEGGG